jgi:hypothetical protein
MPCIGSGFLPKPKLQGWWDWATKLEPKGFFLVYFERIFYGVFGSILFGFIKR